MATRPIYRISITLADNPRIAEAAQRNDYRELAKDLLDWLTARGYQLDGDLQFKVTRDNWTTRNEPQTEQ